MVSLVKHVRPVPDAGTTLVLLGGSIGVLGLFRRQRSAR
jgi:hypothetical protein